MLSYHYLWNAVRNGVLAIFILLISVGANAQFSVRGSVKDSEGQPLVGASVVLSLSESQTTTDLEGNFHLVLNKLYGKANTDGGAHYYQLTISYLGYQSHFAEVEMTEGKDLDLGEIVLAESLQMIDELTVYSLKADYNTPMAVTDMTKADISRNNVGVDLPYLLEMTPSVVVTSDAGAGVGYTGIRIRGSDPTRTNITINGIPLNDAESQGTFLVDLPDFASSVNSLQIQRGVGTSTNGAGAFGATVGLQTNRITKEPYGEISNSYGSFNSRKHTIQFGSGLIKEHFSFEGRLSHILSDGFIDRASSNLKSFYFSAAFVNNKTLIRANIFSGNEETYQAWGGVPVQYVQDTGRSLGYFGKATDSLRRYNPYSYEKEVDNYTQTHYQLHFNQQIFAKLHFNASLHYTKGKGYYEQYRSQDALADYGLADVQLGDTTISESDIIRRRWLDNDFYGIIYGVDYSAGRWKLILGGGWNRYVGRHFGEVIWSQYASNGNIRHRYYDDTGIKLDGNTYLKFQLQAAKGLFVYADMQHRYVHYSFLGNTYDNQGNIIPINLDTALHFFNPKVGLSYQINSQHRSYLSFAMANREPNREDYTSAVEGSFPKAEQLYDVELGYEFATTWISAGANLYYMHYRNQLVLTGQLNDVGAYIRRNVPQSYRMGIELQTAIRARKWLEFSGNITLSRNKIVEWTEYVDNWDTWAQETVEHRNKDIAFSPSVVAGSELCFIPLDIYPNADGSREGHRVEISWIQKTVGKQYIDNTQSESRALNGYWTNDFRLSYRFTHKLFKNITLSFLLKNAMNAQYSSNAWVYRFRSDGYDPTPDDPYTAQGDAAGYYNMIGLYPQAGRHFWLSLLVRI